MTSKAIRNTIDPEVLKDHTKTQLGKAMQSIYQFLSFTTETETETDYPSGYVPTLDFQVRMEKGGSLIYKFYSKPMANKY